MHSVGWALACAGAEFVLAVAALGVMIVAGRRRRSWHCWRWLALAGVAWTLSHSWRMAEETVVADAPVAVTVAAAAGGLLPLLGLLGLRDEWPPRQARGERTELTIIAVSSALALLAALWPLPVVAAARRQVDTLVVLVPLVADTLVIAAAAALLLYRGGRSSQQPLLIGLICVAASDVLCTATTGHLPAAVLAVDTLWVAGFGALAYAAARQAPGQVAAEPVAGGQPAPARPAPTRYGSLHWTMVASGAAMAVEWLLGLPMDNVPLVMLCGLAVLTLVHHHVAVRHNRHLLAQLDYHEAQSRHAGQRDPLTGFPTRAAFEASVADAWQRERPLSVVKLQLNRSYLLDHLTLDDANIIVMEIANRIAVRVGYGDCLARSSETTFAVLISGEQDAAIDFVHEVMLAAEVPVGTPHLRMHVTLAAGVASVPAVREPDSSPASLMQHAAIALGTVASTPGGIAVFTPELLRSHVAQLQLHEAVTASLHANPEAAVRAMFEPVVELESGTLIGLAARAEWHHDDHPTISAGQLTALVQEAGLAPQLDRAVLTTAITTFAAWRDRWPHLCQQLWVAVRAGTLTSAELDFPNWLTDVLAGVRLPADALVLECPDRPQIPTACGLLRRLRTTGVHVLVNDALVLAEPSELRHYQCDGDNAAADFFDISPTLVNRCVDDVRARRLVQATVEYAQRQRAATAARLVTGLDQHEQLRELGVTVARGPLYGSVQHHQQTERLIESAAAGTWQSPVHSETLQRRSSQAWQELRHLVSRLPIAAFACDPDGDLILAEGALFDQLGLPADRINQTLTNIIGNLNPSTGRRPLATPLRQALRGIPSVTTVAVGTYWLQVHLSPQREVDRTISGVLGVAIDITHRIQAEHALRNSERRFREVFTGAPIGMMIVGSSGQVVEANPALATMLGRRPVEMVGCQVPTLWHPDSPHEGPQQYAALRAGTVTSYRAERAYQHRDGSPVWTRINVGAMPEASDPGTAIVIVEDIREIKQLEVELRHAQKLEAIGMLAAGIAHEINTPIQFISDNTHFLANAYQQVTQVLDTANQLVRDAGDEPARRLADAADEADLPWLLDQIPRAASHSLEGVAQVADIVRAMRNFGHPDQREQQSVCLNAAVRDTAVIAHNVVKHAAELHLDLGDLPQLAGYPSELNQVVLNLFVNAAHAITDRGGGRGNIWVRTWSDEQAAYLSVADDGCGMTADVKERIFDPFFTTKEVGRGTGQGLTIVYNAVVEKHQGSIGVDSTPGTGTTITVRLPLPDAEFEIDDSDFDLLEYEALGPTE